MAFSTADHKALDAVGVDDFLSSLTDAGLVLPARLRQVCLCSPYFYEQLKWLVQNEDSLFLECWTSGPRDAGEWRQRVLAVSEKEVDDAGLMRALRQLRRREQLRFIYREFCPEISLSEQMQELSDFADACIDIAQRSLHERLSREYGIPRNANGVAQPFVVLGLGKLGAQELNLSSDVDLIFAYPEDGETDGSRSLSNQEFFVRLGQRLISVLDKSTADGFVFRVDMRLRPWGEGSVLAGSFAALESYYEQHGREWERYALIKARAIAGNIAAGNTLLTTLSPFVYRRYIDFSAFAALRAMKEMIAREERRRGSAENIKLGAGGIREIEFIVQAFQLIRGGVNARLRQRDLCTVLRLLGEEAQLPQSVVAELADAYVFLRRLEHRLQALADQQTQTLPDSPLDRARIALSMGFAEWESFYHQLNIWRHRVQTHFAEVVAGREVGRAVEMPVTDLVLLWRGEHEDAFNVLASLGYSDTVAIEEMLRKLHDSRAVTVLPPLSRDRLDRFIPLLLKSAAQSAYPDRALARALPLVESVLRRTAYLVLLMENPGAMERLIELCAASPWIANELACYPVLLDELLNSATLYSPPPLSELRKQLREQLLRLPVDDVEARMEALRIFKKGQVLRVAASDVTGALPIMKVSDYLTWIAEAVLEEVVAMAWRDLADRHGVPCRKDGSRCSPGFLVLGYGKLGGLELGYGSDLDLVFLHDGDAERETDGARPVDGASFFARLGQKVIHILTTPMSSGLLYAVDVRLRPSGNAGLLVSTLSAFLRYQRESAWTWEHQALVRARPVAGDAALAAQVSQLREEILCRPRNSVTLAEEVAAMRKKMRNHLGEPSRQGADESGFHLKHDRGGIVDIEFMVQYGVLAWAHRYPQLTLYTDNVRLLEEFANRQLLPVDDADGLREAYLAYRACSHRKALANEEVWIEPGKFQAERMLVCRLWQELIESGN